MPKRETSDVDVTLKKRRKRTAFNPVQQTKLEHSFQKDHWPNRNRKERLAQELDMSLQSVRTWFQNRRAKEKREDDYRETEVVKQKANDKKATQAKDALQGKGESIKIAASGSPASLFNASHKFMTRSKVKKEIRVKALQHGDKVRTSSGSEFSEHTTDEEEDEGSTAEEEGDAEDEEECVEVEKSSMEQSSDSGTEETSKVSNDSDSNNPAPRRYVKACKTEGDIVIAKHSPRVTADMFTSLIDMMSIVEGGIIKPNDSAYTGATNHALYGIPLKAGDTLFYDKDKGFSFDQTQNE